MYKSSTKEREWDKNLNIVGNLTCMSNSVYLRGSTKWEALLQLCRLSSHVLMAGVWREGCKISSFHRTWSPAWSRYFIWDLIEKTMICSSFGWKQEVSELLKGVMLPVWCLPERFPGIILTVRNLGLTR